MARCLLRFSRLNMAEGILHAGMGERFVERQCYNILSFPTMRERFFQEVNVYTIIARLSL